MCLSIKVARPDDVLAEGEHLGFEWAVTNNGNGYRCGYVRLPVGHPWHGADHDDSILDDVKVHGGLTFSRADEPCHKPGPDDAWWLGFDCAHTWDLPDPSLPQIRFRDPLSSMVAKLYSSLEESSGGQPRCEVCSQEYVEAQCRSLCEQAAAAWHFSIANHAFSSLKP